ncbi:CDP-alcohol phosphatidyltransferase [Amnibacterium sp.]|uniref:CDP-alcohol phosphatidyltransferase n=1 Tax=Amnibacterium sp. TaxID=1872496 RepID=UPI002628C1C4|nr:CDP-alcohol phosphatidyltransferase [Amnibacterium sp.]MCU1474522.1 CDP-alcohol phosphatidyltransferase [Amnibacterium sp.]
MRESAERAGAGGGGRRSVARVAGVLLVWTALVVPDAVADLRPAALLRLPLEGILLAGLLAVLPRRAGRLVAVLSGVLLTILTIAKALNAAVGAGLGRPFDPVSDVGQLSAGAGVVADALGVQPVAVVVVAVVLVAVCFAVLVGAVLAIAGAVRARPRRALRVVAGLTAVWAALALVGAALVPGEPLASTSEAAFTASEVAGTVASAAAVRSFGAALQAPDPFTARSSALRSGPLQGKDVLVVFVESYGQVAVRGTSFSPGVDAALTADTRTLRAAGFSARTGTLISPTFGGISWLAHSTLQSGVWVPNQTSYDRLLATKRLTLTRAFHAAGWRTVSDVPSDKHPWAAGQRFYGYDRMYDATNVGYAGPSFSYATMPDQYTLAHFAQAELMPHHAPVMAEIDLVSSHTPWTPLPHLVDPATVGDGSVYDGMPGEGIPPAIAWQNPATVRALYGESIQYSIDALTDFVVGAHDPNLVVVMLGDHQPAEIVSGPHADRDVPVSLITADPAVLQATTGWGWAPGLRPADHGAAWRMDRFRDRFLAAFARG